MEVPLAARDCVERGRGMAKQHLTTDGSLAAWSDKLETVTSPSLAPSVTRRSLSGSLGWWSRVRHRCTHTHHSTRVRFLFCSLTLFIFLSYFPLFTLICFFPRYFERFTLHSVYNNSTVSSWHWGSVAYARKTGYYDKTDKVEAHRKHFLNISSVLEYNIMMQSTGFHSDQWLLGQTSDLLTLKLKGDAALKHSTRQASLTDFFLILRFLR